jgi:creatinine amidohydrolase/Fe(II)-dependent formamide hydrolase-like protein
MPKVFQIAYSGELMFTREALMKSRGYAVESVLGNDAAKKVLEAGGDYHLFIIGHAGSQEERQEVMRWLRQKFPKAKVLALNPPHVSRQPDADYNVALNGPEKWLAVVQEAVGS